VDSFSIRNAVDARILRFKLDAFGDWKPVGDGLSESRIDYGLGYRIYYATDDEEVLLLCGGGKKTQDSDIASAKAI
jgi:putative addiction module killer protein